VIDDLTERQREILALVAEGLSNKQIAARVYLSIETVKTHLSAIYDHLDVRNRTEAAAIYAHTIECDDA
jgi:DNA-binding NarL/FixJ family response regulator